MALREGFGDQLADDDGREHQRNRDDDDGNGLGDPRS
jgi:hypothetical protein